MPECVEVIVVFAYVCEVSHHEFESVQQILFLLHFFMESFLSQLSKFPLVICYAFGGWNLVMLFDLSVMVYQA